MALKLLTLNTEGNKHFEQFLPFLHQQQADVICLQEVFRVDIPTLEAAAGMTSTYTPQAKVSKENPYLPTRGEWGVMLLTRLPVHQIETFTYVGDPAKLPIFYENPDPQDTRTTNNSMNRVGIAATVREAEGQEITIVTTHFTWSPNGSSTPEQATDAVALRSKLATLPPHILCGDMNSPRGGQTFEMLKEGYHDALPSTVKSTLDPKLHSVGHLDLAVDVLLAHPEYEVSDVRVHTGVSDHQAITATISRK